MEGSSNRYSRNKPLTEEELLDIIDNLSDLSYCSDEDNNGEDDWHNIVEGEEVIQTNDPNLEPEEPTEIIEHEEETRFTKKDTIAAFFANNGLTRKEDIVWRRNVTYITPKIKWYAKKPENEVSLESPLQFFENYFHENVYTTMAECTNLYAVQQQVRFEPTVAAEMKVFVGVHIMMGNLHYPRVRNYWEARFSIPLIAANMTLNRFFKLRQNLHFVDAQNRPQTNDRFWKVRPLYSMLRARCLALPLETNLCIDEQMVPFKGNLNVKQYIRARVNRFQKPPFSSDKDLQKKGRGSSEEIISGDWEIIMTKWIDNNAVFMASNYAATGTPDICKRWDKIKKEYIHIQRPQVIREYNMHMGGVDKMDFLITIYRTFIRSRKWTLRMFTHAIDIALVNGWLEYKSKASLLGVPKQNIMDLLHFRSYVAEGLILVKKVTTKRRGRPSASASPSSSTPVELTPTSSRNRPEIRPIAEVRVRSPSTDSPRWSFSVSYDSYLVRDATKTTLPDIVEMSARSRRVCKELLESFASFNLGFAFLQMHNSTSRINWAYLSGE
ncbi:transposase is4 [Holotrichia oblita]|uniref:Transposase is4 n=1 Tax=Holotrichia oblita TaxID=644536 RepID=A0ACB9TB05_HOLOL|nr:transposase is4 [Holotrichia oblita]